MSFKLYDILGLPKTATTDEIKKAYRKRAVVEHPDKGGDAEKFKELSRAYSVLSDEEEKQKYDSMGDDLYNGNRGNQGGFDINTVFSQMFGNMGGFPFSVSGNQQNRPRQPKQHENVYHNFKISLKESFTGLTKKVKIHVKKPCFFCIEECKTCSGVGVISEMIQMGPFIQMRQRKCDRCNGLKQTKKSEFLCNNCFGGGNTTDEVHLQVDLLPGVTNEHCVVFKGVGEQPQSSGDIPGDFIVTITVDDDPLFVRRGDDLVHSININFIDTIFGKKIIVPLYGEKFEVDLEDYLIIKPNEEYIIKGKGMPKSNNGFGDLVIIFKVTYPTNKDFMVELQERIKHI
jgi:DnaJ family protein A protein 2